MERFIPYEKQSKKAKRALDQARRRNWGEISPVTRRAENKKTYKRTKPSRWFLDDNVRVLFCLRSKQQWGYTGTVPNALVGGDRS